MNSPRIRYLIQPEMSADDRNLTITNGVRTIMTTTAFPTHSDRRSARQQGLELLVSRVAVGMLRWSQHRTARRRITHDEMMLLRRVQKDSANAIDMSRLSRLG